MTDLEEYTPALPIYFSWQSNLAECATAISHHQALDETEKSHLFIIIARWSPLGDLSNGGRRADCRCLLQIRQHRCLQFLDCPNSGLRICRFRIASILEAEWCALKQAC